MPAPRLLLIEDDHDVAALLTTYFTYSGYDVFHSITGRGGVALARHRLPNVILLDVMLPDIDGFDTLMLLRAQALSQHIPVIFLTQRDTRADRAVGLGRGAIDYVPKPFDMEELGLRVGNAVARGARAPLYDARTGLPCGALTEEALLACEASEGALIALGYQVGGLPGYADAYGFVAADALLAFAGRTARDVVAQHGAPADYVGLLGDVLVVVTPRPRATTLDGQLRAAFARGTRAFQNAFAAPAPPLELLLVGTL